MKKYRFLFLTLLFGMFFIPKDVFAANLNTNITFYDSDYNVIAECQNCTELYNIVDGYYEPFYNVFRVRYTYKNTPLFKNLDYKFQTKVLLNYCQGRPATYIGLCYNGQCPTVENTWSRIDLIEDTPVVNAEAVTYEYIGNWTQTENADEFFIEIYFDKEMDMFLGASLESTLSTTGDTDADIIAGVGQNIISNNNANTDKIIENENKNHEEAQETRKGIWETIKSLPGEFLNMLKSLFIPSDNYFSDKFNSLLDKVNNQLGLLSYPLTLVVETFEFFITIEDKGEYVIRWDDIKVPNFEEYTIIKAGYLDFSQLLKDIEPLRVLHSLYMVFVNALLVLSFVKLCHNTYTDVFGGHYDYYEYITVAEGNYFDSDGVLTASRVDEAVTRKRKVF